MVLYKVEIRLGADHLKLGRVHVYLRENNICWKFSLKEILRRIFMKNNSNPSPLDVIMFSKHYEIIEKKNLFHLATKKNPDEIFRKRKCVAEALQPRIRHWYQIVNLTWIILAGMTMSWYSAVMWRGWTRLRDCYTGTLSWHMPWCSQGCPLR